MDFRHSNYVPHGWVKTTKNGRIVFKTSHPNRVVIQNKKMLEDYQKQGRYHEANADKMDFRKEKIVQMDVCEEDAMDIDDNEDHEIMKVKKSPAEEEREQIEFGTKMLHPNLENPLNHSKELETAGEILTEVMIESSTLEMKIDVDLFKQELASAETNDSFLEVLKNKKELYQYFSVLARSKSLSEMINLPLDPSSPLVGWPCNINENIYSEIIKLAKSEAKDVLAFLCNVIVPKDQPISQEHVVRVGDIFSTFAHSVSRNQNALSKLKSIVLQSEGLTTAGIDRIAKLKGAECSTTLSRGRHLLGELGESSFKSRIKQGKGFTITCDNLNLKQQNMTQSIIVMEKKETNHLPNDPLPPHLLPELFEIKNFLLTSPHHNEMKKHLEYVAAVKVGRILGEYVEEAHQLKKFLPHTHKHLGSNDEKIPSEIFVSPPDYLNEMENAEFFKFCMLKQTEFLYAVAESVENKEAFLFDLEIIMCSKVIETGVLESEQEVLTREDAERKVHHEVEKFGRWIGFGDALTFKQFHYGAKALAKGNYTAYERLEYLSHFRVALFHAKMAKAYQDYPVLMPKRSMMEDEGTLPELVALAGIQGISTDEKKIGNAFEKHDQLLLLIGHLYAVNMFKNFIKDYPTKLGKVKDEVSAVEFVQEMLAKYEVEYYYDPEKKPSAEHWDDPGNYARNVVARMILGELFDAGEEEEDSCLLRSLRLTMVVYFLNRKFKKQDSKYAAFLFTDEIMEQQASVRDRERMKMASCVNPSGKRGGGLFT